MKDGNSHAVAVGMAARTLKSPGAIAMVGPQLLLVTTEMNRIRSALLKPTR